MYVNEFSWKGDFDFFQSEIICDNLSKSVAISIQIYLSYICL